MHDLDEIELIIGNSGRNFSGVTSVTIQLLNYQAKEFKLAVLGSAFIPDNFRTINFYQFIKLQERFFPQENTESFSLVGMMK